MTNPEVNNQTSNDTSFEGLTTSKSDIEEHNTGQPSKLKLVGINNDCSLNKFNKLIEDSIAIDAEYYQCEPDWKINLKIKIGNYIVFNADSLNEYEFKESYWPTFIRIDKNTFQVLLEVNDRPAKNKIQLLEFEGLNLTQNQVIPHFQHEGSDIDHDGILEFTSYLDYLEPCHTDSSYYIPLICYENTNKRFKLDTIATKDLNTQIWGDFFGFELRRDIKLPISKKLYDY